MKMKDSVEMRQVYSESLVKLGEGQISGKNI